MISRIGVTDRWRLGAESGRPTMDETEPTEGTENLSFAGAKDVGFPEEDDVLLQDGCEV